MLLGVDMQKGGEGSSSLGHAAVHLRAILLPLYYVRLIWPISCLLGDMGTGGGLPIEDIETLSIQGRGAASFRSRITTGTLTLG